MAVLQNLRVFLASPSDVDDERGLALRVLERLRFDPSLRDRVTIEAVAWDHPNTSTPFLAGISAQDAVTRITASSEAGELANTLTEARLLVTSRGEE